MTRLQFGCIVFATVFTSLVQNSYCQERETIELWPKGLPADSKAILPQRIEELKTKNTDERIAIVETPSLTVFPAETVAVVDADGTTVKEKSNGCAVVICPGGGYNILAWKKEGLELAEWFNSIGVTAFVLKYRVPRRNPDRIHWEPLQDVQRAIRLVRHYANKYKIDPDRIGVLGFSAGGHLTVMSGVQYETVSYPKFDVVDELSCRPDFICPIYVAYLADGYRDDIAELGELVKVNKTTPPTFLAVTWDDSMRGAQSALLFAELKKNNVQAEIHAYTKGGHGYGIRASDHPVSKWNLHLGEWLKSMKFLDSNE